MPDLNVDAVVGGSIPLAEISAADVVGQWVLLIADDLDENDDHTTMLALLDDGAARLRAGGAIDLDRAADARFYRQLLAQLDLKKKDLTDLEDMAVTPAGEVYVISSHSRNKKGEEKPARQRLLRLRVGDDGLPEQAMLYPQALTPQFPEQLRDSLQRRPGHIENGEYRPGLNIEGLCWVDGDLLLGLRSPTLAGCAVVLRLAKVADGFARVRAQSLQIAGTPDLGQGRGIRGMCHDPAGGCWLIAGLSADPDDGTPHPRQAWSVLYWNEVDGSVKERLRQDQMPAAHRLTNPEAIALLPATAQLPPALLLISDDGAGAASRYVVIPFADAGASKPGD